MEKKTTKKNNHSRLRIQSIALCALMTAVTAVLAQVVIPTQPVPVNLATLGVCIAGGLLGARGGAASQIIYVLLGAVGVPVFSSFGGGLGRLAGPTGGYIIGYIAAALIIGLLVPRCANKFYWIAPALAAGILVCYAFGTVWYIILTHTGLGAALMTCVVPFLLGDLLKIVLATLLIVKLKKPLDKLKNR